MHIAQALTFPRRDRTLSFPIPLTTKLSHISLLPIEHNIVLQLIVLSRIVRDVAEFVDVVFISVLEMRPRPGLADPTAPVEFPTEIQTAIFGARVETGVFVVDGLEAEVLSDEGGVQVAVVVVELEVVRFVVFGVVEIHAVAAVAEGADEIVAGVGAGVVVGEAIDAADVGVFFG